MKILVLNAGSSSLKYQLIDMNDEKVIAKGLCERIGLSGCIKHKTEDGRVYEAEIPMPSHNEAIDAVMHALTKSDAKVIDSYDEISAIGHRVVQGGMIFSKSTLVDEKVIADVESLSELAPLHNHPNALGIQACLKLFGEKVPQVTVFDTAFHQTMPPKAYIYGIPYEYYEKYKVRRYGFHGTSHKFVSDRCAELMNRDKKDIKMVTCHLGNGCSISAIENGKCIDTTMGFTPHEGLVMGTRSGTLDSSILTYLADKEHVSSEKMSDICNTKSGMLGISGVSSDNRDITESANQGNERAELAIEVQTYQITKYVGSFVAALNGVDAIVFTGGIGENDSKLREDVMAQFSYMGVKINSEENKKRGQDVEISTDDSAVKVFVIPTNEELVIARETLEIVKNLK